MPMNPDWMADALCQYTDPDLFFPEQEGIQAEIPESHAAEQPSGPVRNCRECGTLFSPKAPRQAYCSDDCLEAGTLARKRRSSKRGTRTAFFAISTDQAKWVCSQCPVISQCLDYAIDRGEEWGIWGGMTTAERREESERRAAGKAA